MANGERRTKDKLKHKKNIEKNVHLIKKSADALKIERRNCLITKNGFSSPSDMYHGLFSLAYHFQSHSWIVEFYYAERRSTLFNR